MDLLLVRRDILKNVRDIKIMRGMGKSSQDHYVVLCKLKLMVTWIKEREGLKLAGISQAFLNEILKWDNVNDIEQMWENLYNVNTEKQFAVNMCGF